MVYNFYIHLYYIQHVVIVKSLFFFLIAHNIVALNAAIKPFIYKLKPSGA